MSEEKGQTSEVERPSTDTTIVEEVQKGVPEPPEVNVPEIESSEMVVPTKTQKQPRVLSEKKLKALENAREKKRQKRVAMDGQVSLLKDQYDTIQKQYEQVEKNWQEKLSAQEATLNKHHEDRYNTLETQFRDMERHVALLMKPAAPPPTPRVATSYPVQPIQQPTNVNRPVYW